MKINNNKIKSLFLLSLVGSGLAKGKKTTNQSRIASPSWISLNSLPSTVANLNGENDPDQIDFFAGYPISLGIDANVNRVLKHFTKYCTAGFAVVNTNSSKCTMLSNDYGGFLTSSFCWPRAVGTSSSEVYSRDGSLLLGNARYSTLKNYKIDYNYISSYGTGTNVEIIPYVSGLTTNDKTVSERYPVIGLGVATLGSKVCAYGVVSGYVCGNLSEVNVELTIPNPWDIINNDGSPNFLTLTGLDEVDLGANGFYAEEDLGGPVYVQSDIGGHITAQALGYISWIDNSDPNHKLLYYTQLDKALNKIFADNNCNYTLMTYNKANTEQFQAQIEVSTKT